MISLYKRNMKNRTNHYGFSLVETFVAITILMIAVLGPMSLLSKFFSDNDRSKNQIAAALLIQEGLEMTANIISNNAERARASESLAGTGCDESREWLEHLDDCIGGSVCNIDAVEQVVYSCSGGSCQPMYKDASGLYRYNRLLPPGATPTVFTREIKVEDISPDPDLLNPDDHDNYWLREAKVTATVKVNSKGKILQYKSHLLIDQSLCI